MKRKGTKDLTYTQRLQLEALLKAGVHKREIARQLGICLATVYNEIKRGECTQKVYSYTDWFGDRHYKQVTVYSPNIAHDKYKLNQSSHGSPLKLGNDYDFVRYIENAVLVEGYSPRAALGRANRLGMFKTRISRTTLYRYIRQGIFLNISMQDCPAHKQKKHKKQKATAKRPPKGTSIEKRPADISARNSFGHWEMDCVIGKSRETLLCFTERLTRYEIVFKMPNRKAATVVKCVNILERRYGSMFRKVFKSITVDNGVEFSDFEGLERSSYNGKRTSLYYCHPYTSCERGSNERLNRELRRKLPKGTNFSLLTKDDIQTVVDWVNAYPRGIFDYATSAEKYAEQIAALQ